MEHINFLRQASLADKVGNYKLADNLFQRALRLAAGAGSIFEVEVLKFLEKLALTAEEKELLKLSEGSLVKTWEKGGSGALASILEKRGLAAVSDETATKEFLRSIGIIEDEALTKMIADLKIMTPEAQKEFIKGRIGAEIARIESEMPAKTLAQKFFNKENVEAALKAAGPFFKKYFIDNPNGFGKFSAWASSAGIVYTLGGEGIQFFSKLTGKEIPITTIIDLFQKVPGLFSSGGPESTPPGSTSPESTSPESAGSGSGTGSGTAGAGGASEQPGPQNNWKYTSDDQMYNLRMKAKTPSGVSQQELQGDKAQKFFNDNKGKFKSQREFYDAAWAAGDQNLANSVIALVKKDMPELPREPVK
jgi:hypothetical protein